MFCGTDTAFIACPGAESVALELEIIKIVLDRFNLKPYIAIDNYDPARDVFCEKICTKIIESRLCVVLLTDPLLPGGHTSPNPNVYYEYGLMTAFAKPIIPLQRKDHVLAFNVRSFDTIKYTNYDLKPTFERVVAETIIRIAQDQQKSFSTTEPLSSLDLYMELRGYGKTNHHLVHRTPFRYFQNSDNSHVKCGIVIRNEADLTLLKKNLSLLGSRFRNLISKKEHKLNELFWTAKQHSQSGAKQNLKEVSHLIESTEAEISTLRQIEVLIVCPDSEQLSEQIRRLSLSASPQGIGSIRILNLAEIHDANESYGKEQKLDRGRRGPGRRIGRRAARVTYSQKGEADSEPERDVDSEDD